MSVTSTSGRPSLLLVVESLEARCVPSNAQYVTALYNDFLHRAPAPSEVTGWASQLNAGADPAQIALEFTTSAEYLGDVIRADYQRFLGRQPSAGEVAGWQAQLQAGLGENQLQAAFLASDEFFVKHGNDVTPWLNGIYQNVLGRAADSGGLATWSQDLKAGLSRYGVAVAIVTNPEAFGRLVSAAYHDLLGRAPDAPGQTYWVTQLEQGLAPSQLLARFAGSAEFIAAKGGLNVTQPVPGPIDPVTVDTFLFTPFIGPPFIGGPTTAGFTDGGFTDCCFTDCCFTDCCFTGCFSCDTC